MIHVVMCARTGGPFVPLRAFNDRLEAEAYKATMAEVPGLFVTIVGVPLS